MMPPDGDLRRQDDQLLASLDKRLALLEQSHAMTAKAADLRSENHDRAIDSLATKVDAAINLWQAVTAEPESSPAGRTILADIKDVRKDLADVTTMAEAHDDYIQQVNGAMRLVRFAVGSSLLALAVSIIQVLLLIAGRTSGGG